MYVIYHKVTTIIPRTMKKWPYSKDHNTEKAARAAITRAHNNGLLKDPPEMYDVASKQDFHERIEVRERRKVLVGDGYCTVAVNTPAYLDPSRNAYWEM